jgi:uncharacterized protein YndB with AHSA1/START domain
MHELTSNQKGLPVMFKIVMLVIVVGVVGFLLYVGFKPSDFAVAREITVKAPPEAIFPYINNSKKAGDWMPWAEIDPRMKMSYSGPDEGVGSKSSWESPGQMGVGEALVVESTQNQSVKTQLTYTKPMVMSQMAEVSLTPSADGTVVKWAVSGKNSFMGRLMCTFMDMDKMIGGQFMQGLTKLKSLVEKPQ